MTPAATSQEDTIEPSQDADWRVLDRACDAAGMSAQGASLIRSGSNAVYRLVVPVIARIAPPGADLDEVRKQVVVARWLADLGYPAVRAVGGVTQPMVIDGRAVTFWVSFGEEDRFAPIEDVARLIRRLHELSAPSAFALPAFDKFAGARDRLRKAAPAMSAESLQFLSERVDAVQDRVAAVRFVLPAGPIHGDANVGNVMLDRNGRALLIDLDGFGIGPREWDLVQTALFYDRFGWHTRAEYETFVEIYGWDIMAWPGYETLADTHEVLMTCWLAQKAGREEKYDVELQKRIEAMRTGASRRDWQPF